MTLEGFSHRMVIRADELGRSVDATVRLVALVVDQIVVLATPVDTGRARSNWLVSVGLPRNEVIEPYSPGNKLGLGERQNAQRAIEQARGAVILRGEGIPIFIVNNVNYMTKLNNGSSRQAPVNFVEIGVQQGVAAVRSAKILSR